MTRRIKLAATSLVVGVAMSGTVAHAAPELELVEGPADRFASSIEAHKAQARYRDTLAEARKLDVAPGRDLLERAEATTDELRRGAERLEGRVERAERARRRADRAETGFGLAPGVSQSTLEAIAACESGGDPSAVDSSGTYFGKYQFDIGTWASVGGTGNPADSSAAEQDYRASLLYSRAGSSPWPVCGA